MNAKAIRSSFLFFLVATAVVLGLASGPARAHCDAESGPVATDAREALKTGNFAPVAIWVGQEQNKELRSAFEQALPVYRIGGKAQALAEQYFMETAVRLHRAAEGFGYTGLKEPRPLPPDVAAAERALQTGDLEPVSGLLAAELDKKLEVLFRQTRNAAKNRDQSIEAGRDWADAYVKYITYVHSLYDNIKAGPAHGVGGKAEGMHK